MSHVVVKKMKGCGGNCGGVRGGRLGFARAVRFVLLGKNRFVRFESDSRGRADCFHFRSSDGVDVQPHL